jgi:hypothetical protein
MSDLSGATPPPPTPLDQLITLLVAELEKRALAKAEAVVATEVKAVEAVLLKRCGC